MQKQKLYYYGPLKQVKENLQANKGRKKHSVYESMSCKAMNYRGEMNEPEKSLNPYLEHSKLYSKCCSKVDAGNKSF